MKVIDVDTGLEIYSKDIDQPIRQGTIPNCPLKIHLSSKIIQSSLKKVALSGNDFEPKPGTCCSHTITDREVD